MRIVFDNIDEFKNWILEFVREDRHVVYVTKRKEVIIVPKVSTRPVILAYAKFTSDEIADVMAVIPETITRFTIRSFDWKDDSPVGSSFLAD